MDKKVFTIFDRSNGHAHYSKPTIIFLSSSTRLIFIVSIHLKNSVNCIYPTSHQRTNMAQGRF